MFNPLTWLKAILAAKPAAADSVDLMTAWRQHVWDWHVPLQMQAIAVCAPFSEACVQQKLNKQSGVPIDKQALQQQFTALIKEMVSFNQFVKEEYFKWYVSEQGAEWKAQLDAFGVASEYLAIAKDILEAATETIILASQQQARDLININELYIAYTAERIVPESYHS